LVKQYLRNTSIIANNNQRHVLRPCFVKNIKYFLTEWDTLEALLSPFSMPGKQNHLSFAQGSFAPFVYLLPCHTFVLHIERQQTSKQDCEHLII
jgi:hypothetical protein